MRFRTIGPAVAASIMLLAPASASADFAHVILPGETLTSIAATDGLSIDALAAANGLSPNAELVSGSIIEIPPQTATTAAPTMADGATDAAAETGASTTTVVSGSYIVQPGDTLTAIAERDDTTVDALAALNGLSPNGLLPAGTALALPEPGTGAATTEATAATTSSASPQYVSDTSGSATASGPYPTPERVDGPEIASIASASGVPASLAQAIGWQESGWNNDVVSDAGAVGVMQIVPSTWQWIQQNEADDSLAPASAADNVRGGVLLLRSLLSLTGSESMAAAGYYQGLASIRAHGLYPSTEHYVANVMALAGQFAGGG